MFPLTNQADGQNATWLLCEETETQLSPIRLHQQTQGSLHQWLSSLNQQVQASTPIIDVSLHQRTRTSEQQHIPVYTNYRRQSTLKDTHQCTSTLNSLHQLQTPVYTERHAHTSLHQLQTPVYTNDTGHSKPKDLHHYTPMTHHSKPTHISTSTPMTHVPIQTRASLHQQTHVFTPNIHTSLHQGTHKRSPRDTPLYTNRHTSVYTSAILVYTNRHIRLHIWHFRLYQQTHASKEQWHTFVTICMTSSSDDEVTVFIVTNANKYGGWEREKMRTRWAFLRFRQFCRLCLFFRNFVSKNTKYKHAAYFVSLLTFPRQNKFIIWR